MFAVPEIIEMEVFASLPVRYRKSGQRSPWGDVNNHRQPTDCFLEGPSFDRHGNLYVVDIPWGRIFKIDPAGEFDLVTEYDGWPNGLKIHKDGRIFVADYKNGIVQVDPATGAVTPVVDHRYSEGMRGCNDLVFAMNGDIYFTDQGQTGLHDPTGRVYRLTAAGKLELLLSNVPSPNGIVLNAAETILYVAVTRGNCVWRVPLMEDGGFSKVGLFVQMSGGVGPDGMAMDAEDGLVVSHFGMGGAWHYDRKGIPQAFLKSCCGDSTTNLAFGGPDNRILHLIDSHTGTIMRTEMKVPGAIMYGLT